MKLDIIYFIVNENRLEWHFEWFYHGTVDSYIKSYYVSKWYMYTFFQLDKCIKETVSVE